MILERFPEISGTEISIIDHHQLIQDILSVYQSHLKQQQPQQLNTDKIHFLDLFHKQLHQRHTQRLLNKNFPANHNHNKNKNQV
jgi:hypothetical protein